MEGRAAVDRGHAEITTTGGRNKDDDGGDDRKDGGRVGACRASARLRAYGGGPVGQGGIWVLGALQRWSAPQWGGQGRPGVSGLMDNPGYDACEAVRRSKRESRAPLFPSAGCGTHGSPVAPLERGEVHRLPEGDYPARPTRHQGDTEKN